MITRYKPRKHLLPLHEAERDYVAFRILPNLNLKLYRTDPRCVRPEWGNNLTELPTIPQNRISGEDRTIARVSLAKTILGCVAGDYGSTTPKKVERLLTDKATRFEGNPAAFDTRWVFDNHWAVFGLRKNKNVTLIPSTEIVQYVPDALRTGEVWSLQPITLEYIGTLERTQRSSTENAELWVRSAK